MRILFALSKDGSTVAVADVQDWETLTEVAVEGFEGSLIEAGTGGFWITEPEAIAFHEGPSFRNPAKVGLAAAALAADPEEERAYAAEEDSGRVVALERGAEGALEVVAEAQLDRPVEYLLAEEERLYALASGEILVLDPENLKTLTTVDFGRALAREDLERAEPSGLAVGEDNLYVTLEGEPFLLQVEKADTR